MSVVPKDYHYADSPVGVRTSNKNQAHRRTLYIHTPARLEYQIRIPQAGRLDFGLGVTREDIPVNFKVIVSQKENEEIVLFEETYSNHEEWVQEVLMAAESSAEYFS